MKRTTITRIKEQLVNMTIALVLILLFDMTRLDITHGYGTFVYYATLALFLVAGSLHVGLILTDRSEKGA